MNNLEAMFGHKLSLRTYNTLCSHGITTKEQVLESYVKGDLLKLRNFGKASHNEVFDWLDKEIDSELKPMKFVIKHDKPKPLTPFQKQLRSMGRIITEISDLRDEIKHMNYVLEQWTHANHDLHKSITVVANERKYIHPTNLQ
jgi:Bacterial RNA polymerase, alpha chain C terminal domain